MPSSDIYNVKEPPVPAQNGKMNSSSRRRRRRSAKTFDETGRRELSKTHRRRSKNNGFRRFRHLLKKPDFSKKFWMVCLYAGCFALASLMAWDQFIRYPEFAPAELGTPEEDLESDEAVQVMADKQEEERAAGAGEVQAESSEQTVEEIFKELSEPEPAGMGKVETDEPEETVKAIFETLKEPPPVEDLFRNGGVSQ